MSNSDEITYTPTPWDQDAVYWLFRHGKKNCYWGIAEGMNSPEVKDIRLICEAPNLLYVLRDLIKELAIHQVVYGNSLSAAFNKKLDEAKVLVEKLTKPQTEGDQ